MGARLLYFSFVACILISQVNSIFFNKEKEEPEQTIHIHYIHHLPAGVAPGPQPSWQAPRENDDKGGLLNILKKLIFSDNDKGGQQSWPYPAAGRPAPVYGPPPTAPAPAPVYGPPSFNQGSYPRGHSSVQQLPAYNPPQVFNPKPVYGAPQQGLQSGFGTSAGSSFSQFQPSQSFSSSGVDSYFPEKSPSGGYQRRAFKVNDNEEFLSTINTAIQDGLKTTNEQE